MSAIQQLKIAYLISQYPAINHTFILREVRRLRELGFDIYAISIEAADRPIEKMTNEENTEFNRTYFIKPQGLSGAVSSHLKVFLSNPINYLKGLFHAIRLGQSNLKKTLSMLFYFVEAIMAGSYMKQHGIYHFHTHFSSTVGLLIKHIFPIEMSMTIHGPDEFNDVVGFHMAEKIAKSTFISAISNYARSQLMKASDYKEWDKIEVSPLGIDPSVFTPRPFRRDPSTFEIICVGRLAPAKAQHILIAAIDQLIREGRDIRLRLVGDGPDRKRLEENIRERGIEKYVVFEGWVNQDGVRNLYKEADLFVLASFAEGVPVVLMEAMAMEIPCVSTNITGIPELIRNGIDGMLVPPSDDRELVNAIKTLMDDPELRERLGRSGRERVIEKYNLSKNTEYLAGIFRRRLLKKDLATATSGVAVNKAY
jgi:colanic acid/amylovoran biosynthesis glycosyltransferase